jgi:RNA polymerase sigma-70 factor (ECF subfamily)
MSGQPELAADVAEAAFIKLSRRGALPDAPEAWLISVAMTLFRNAKSTGSRRVPAAPGPSLEQAFPAESRRRVRSAIDRLPDRERRLLLLRAEGYSYRDMAAALDLNEASIGTLLARARAVFRECYEES